MAIRKFSTASISAGTNKSTKLWDQETFQSGMFALATVSLTSSQSAIAFTDIPANYTHLHLRMLLRSDTAAVNTYLGGYLNGDGATNYSRHQIIGDGSSATAGAATSAGLWAIDSGVSSASNTAGVFSAFVIDFLDYTSTTKAKTIRALNGYDNNGSGAIRLQSNAWYKNTSSVYEAINQISLFSGGNFIAGSHAALYGIKVA
jgi:hypothetical protein